MVLALSRKPKQKYTTFRGVFLFAQGHGLEPWLPGLPLKARRLGFEPRLPGPEPGVLPLDDLRALSGTGATWRPTARRSPKI